MADHIPTTISTFHERWWAGPLARRRIIHQLSAGEDESCSYPDCAWHGVMPGEENLVAPAAPP